jgi:hypothetical protein
MADEISGIADASKPNAGRIYDYFLGGNHNFEIDRQAAEQLLQSVPSMPQFVRLIRWFLGEAVRRLVEEGHKYFLDFASGLPTVDHIHQAAPDDVKVVYSDIDPVTVAYAQQIVEGRPNVRFIQGDAAKPTTVLDSPAVKELFGEERCVVMGFNGIAWFLTDDQLGHAMRTVYDWSAPGSKLYICDLEHRPGTETERFNTTIEFYKSVGQPVYLRSRERLVELCRPWRVRDPGFQMLEDWIGIDRSMTEEGRAGAGGSSLIGAILQK